MLKPTRILVPTDFSEYSDRALGQALDIARQYKAKVFLLHVVHEDIYRAALEFTFLEEAVQKFRDGAAAWAQKSLQKQLGYFPQAQEAEVVTNVRRGIPYNEILREGKEQGIDLIVIASLGRSGIAKYFIGSVARNVLRGSPCPVLLTR
ncbi:MAG: UspA protein [Deltaproteobacteria bacterium]|nr:UspA protein [Deltaproteobacteria bacterium]